MAALLFVVLAHKQSFARGERVSAGPGIEYMVGNDGLLYQTEVIKGPGKPKYRTAPLPGVHPDHVEKLCRSANIVERKDYKGPVYSAAKAATPTVPTGGTVDKGAYDALQASHDTLSAENADLRAQLEAATASSGGEPKGDASPAAAPPPPPAPPAPAASKPPPPPPPPADPPKGDNAPASVDIPAVLGLSVGKLGAEVASGKHDAILADLRAAEAAGKNRTGALGVIDARIDALKG